jgi:hypothetical protein
LTCGSCNAGLGFFKDDIDIMEKAIKYLIANATPTEYNLGSARERCKIKPSEREFTDEGKEIKRQKMTGNKLREGIPAWNRDKSWSEEIKAKMSESTKHRKTKEIPCQTQP